MSKKRYEPFIEKTDKTVITPVHIGFGAWVVMVVTILLIMLVW